MARFRRDVLTFSQCASEAVSYCCLKARSCTRRLFLAVLSDILLLGRDVRVDSTVDSTSVLKSRTGLVLENLTLRHQIEVLQRSAKNRLSLNNSDRLFG